MIEEWAIEALDKLSKNIKAIKKCWTVRSYASEEMELQDVCEETRGFLLSVDAFLECFDLPPKVGIPKARKEIENVRKNLLGVIKELDKEPIR